ncbi:MAG TPA: aminotransferase class V-fold PLP-dependent enzyme [Candidatus Acidoferrales bacterium]|nr:aminotransferase class V-fold PLP-dependent enzyme [Candidatus Acidoferrales bacterium]
MSTPLPREEFPVTEKYAYFNHAAVGILPKTTVAEIERFVRAQSEAGLLGTFPYEVGMPQSRERIGRFINASGEEIAITPNTSHGANLIALGLDVRPGDRILLCDNEFPSNAIPWLALRSSGAEVVELDTRYERLTPDRLRRELTPGTRAVAVSWVSYSDGYRHDLAGLAEVAHAAGALLCVDAIQGLGAFPLDVRATNVDALYTAAAKWLLGLQGVGFTYVRRDLIDRLQLAMPGWRSVEDMWDFHNHEQGYSPHALRFEGGTPSFLGTLSMTSSIGVLERAGVDAIAAHVLQLTDRLADGLVRAGAELLAPRGPGISSGIVTFRLPGCDSVALGRAMQREGIVTTWRPGGIRVSPHGYNDAGEIDRLLATLAECARTLTAKG